MELITERSLIRTVAARWKEQASRRSASFRVQAISAKLDALDGETATAQDVADIIGNHSWTDVPSCDECGEQTDAVVRVGEEPDDESATAWFCLECLQKAAAMITGKEGEK